MRYCQIINFSLCLLSVRLHAGGSSSPSQPPRSTLLPPVTAWLDNVCHTLTPALKTVQHKYLKIKKLILVSPHTKLTPPSFSAPSPSTGHDILMFYRQRSDFDHCCPCLSTAPESWQSVKLNVKTEEKHCISDLGYDRFSDFSSCHSLRYKPPREVARFIQIDNLFLISQRPTCYEICRFINNKNVPFADLVGQQ